MDFYKGLHNAFSPDATIPLTLSWSIEVIIRTKMLKGWKFLIKRIKEQVVLFLGAEVRLDEEAHKFRPTMIAYFGFPATTRSQ